MIHFTCQQCGTPLKTGLDKSEKLTRCPKCQEVVRVPKSVGALAPIDYAEESAYLVPLPEEVSPEFPLAPAPAYLPDTYADEPPNPGQRRSMYLALGITGTLGLLLVVGLAALLSGDEKKPPAKPSPAVARAQILPPIARPPAPRPAVEQPVAKISQPRSAPELTLPVEAAPIKTNPKTPEPPKELPEPRPEQKPAEPRRETLSDTDRQYVAECVKTLRSRRVQDRLRAAKDLADLGPKAKDASRALCEAMLDPIPQVAVSAAAALEAVNPLLHGNVVTLLVDKDGQSLGDAIQRLQRLGIDAQPAVPILVATMPRINNSEIIAETLSAIAGDDKTAARAFEAWLVQHKNPLVRVASAKALARMDAGKDAVKVLIAAVRGDREAVVREAAARALGDIGPDAKEAVPALNYAKTDQVKAVREAATAALEKVQGR